MGNKQILYAAMASGIITVSIAVGWYVRALKCDLAKEKAITTAQDVALAETERANGIAAELEKAKAASEKTRVIFKDRIVYAKDSSFGCTVNDDGLQLINDARKAGNPR